VAAAQTGRYRPGTASREPDLAAVPVRASQGDPGLRPASTSTRTVP
jgi:hypothetical protein